MADNEIEYVRIVGDQVIPKFITKFFQPEHEELVHGGSVRFGSLEGYRNSESTIAAMSDQGEGTRSFTIESCRDFSNLDVITLPGGSRFTNPTASGFNRAFVAEQRENANVYCAQPGTYCRINHNHFTKGYERYPGNPAYTAYIVYDFFKFCLAVTNSYTNYIREKTLDPSLVSLAIGEVIYDDQYRNQTNHDFPDKKNIDLSNFIDPRTPFVKPTLFGPENEIRLLLTPKLQQFQNTHIELISDAIKQSIVDKGRHKPLCK